MTEKMLNDLVDNVIHALAEKNIFLDKKELFQLMYKEESIYQIVLSDLPSEKKASLIFIELFDYP